MVILALETATRRGSVALCTDGDCVAAEGDDGRTHAERLPGAVTDWLSSLGRSVRDVDRLAVVSGPGSFTGLRVGLAAIQGLALATGKQVIPVPTLEAVASGWRDRDPAPGFVVACVDGQRGEVFAAGWDCGEAARLEDCRLVIEPCAAQPESLARLVSERQTRAPVILAGDGAILYRDVWQTALPGARVEAFAAPLALSAVRLAARRPDVAVSPHALKPVYLRRPDVELSRSRTARSPPLAITIALAAAGGDVTAVEALQRRAVTYAWGAEAIRWELEHTDVARLYVARGPDGQLVAYCACWMIFDELHINSLAVEDAWRRRGVAGQLLRRVIANAMASGATQATLEVRASNQAARRLYEGLGFTVEAVRRDYYQEPREDALILWNRRLFTPGRPLW